MKPNLWSLARHEAKRQRWSLYAVSLLAVICGALVSSALIGVEWVQYASRAMSVSDHQALSVTVRPPRPQGNLGISFERPLISDDDIAYLRQLPDVRSVRPIKQIPAPSMIGIRFPGFINAVQTIALYEVEADSLPAELRAVWDRPTLSDGRTPIIINAEALTLFNLGFADRYGMPRVNLQAVQDRNFDVYVGRDEFMNIGKSVTVKTRIVGSSYDFPPWGIAINPATAAQFRQQLAEVLPRGYGIVSAVVECRNSNGLDQVEAAIERLNLSYDDRPQLATLLAKAVRWTRLSSVGLTLVLIFIFAAAIITSLSMVMSERRRQVALWISLGARAWHLVVILGTGLGLRAAMAAAIGTLAAWLAAPTLINWLISHIATVIELPHTFEPSITPLILIPLATLIMVLATALLFITRARRSCLLALMN